MTVDSRQSDMHCPVARASRPSPEEEQEAVARAFRPSVAGDATEPAGRRSHCASSRSFAALAKRISSWTSKGLVSALILAAGLAIGNEVLRWWRADKTLPSPAEGLAVSDAALASDGLGDPAREHQLRFGDSPWAMTCRTIVASKHDALTMLRAACAESIRSGDGLPTTPPDAAEREWLGRIGGRQPVEQEPGRWVLYELEEPNLMVVGTRAGLRVVTWAVAIPGDGGQWTLYTLQWTPSAEAGDGRRATTRRRSCRHAPPGARESSRSRRRAAGRWNHSEDPRIRKPGCGFSTPGWPPTIGGKAVHGDNTDWSGTCTARAARPGDPGRWTCILAPMAAAQTGLVVLAAPNN